MPSFTKFQNFVTVIMLGSAKLYGDFATLGVDGLKIYLTNTAPNAATNSLKSDLAEISTGNGYTGPIAVSNNGTTSGGTFTLTGISVRVTASGGGIGPFRYVVLYNDTPTGPPVGADPLIGYWDLGSNITIASGDSTDFRFNSALNGVAGTLLTLV